MATVIQGNMVVQQNQTQAVSAGAPSVATMILPGSSGCECGVPVDATCSARVACGGSVFVLVVSVITLIESMFLFWVMPLSLFYSLMAVIMSGVLLCCYNRCVYITGAVFYWVIFFMSVGQLCIVFPALFLLVYAIIPYMLGIIALLIAAAGASGACCCFEDPKFAVSVAVPGVQHGVMSYHNEPERVMIQPAYSNVTYKPKSRYNERPPPPPTYNVGGVAVADDYELKGHAPPAYGDDLESGPYARAPKDNAFSNVPKVQPDVMEYRKKSAPPALYKQARRQTGAPPPQQYHYREGSGSGARNNSAPPPPYEMESDEDSDGEEITMENPGFHRQQHEKRRSGETTRSSSRPVGGVRTTGRSAAHHSAADGPMDRSRAEDHRTPPPEQYEDRGARRSHGRERNKSQGSRGRSESSRRGGGTRDGSRDRRSAEPAAAPAALTRSALREHTNSVRRDRGGDKVDMAQ